MEHQEENQPIAGQLDDTKVDMKLLERLENASDAFMVKYKKNVPLACVRPNIINGEAALIALVNLPEGTLVDLPAKFEEYSVIINYGAIELAHRTSHQIQHQTLKPGISISDTRACTLGALFKIENQNETNFILTVQHGVGDINNLVIQPGSADEVCTQ